MRAAARMLGRGRSSGERRGVRLADAGSASRACGRWAMDDGTVGLKKSGAVGGAIDRKQQTGIASFTNFAPVDPHIHGQHTHYGR